MAPRFDHVLHSLALATVDFQTQAWQSLLCRQSSPPAMMLTATQDGAR